MTDSEKIDKLRRAFTQTIWMSIRYAHGRNTYAPSEVRDAVKEFQTVFPDWKPTTDTIIQPAKNEGVVAMGFYKDYLNDLF